MSHNTIKSNEVTTLDALFRERVARTPELAAYREYDQETDQWVSSSWAEIGHEVARWQVAFVNESLRRGDQIGRASCRERV